MISVREGLWIDCSRPIVPATLGRRIKYTTRPSLRKIQVADGFLSSQPVPAQAMVVCRMQRRMACNLLPGDKRYPSPVLSHLRMGLQTNGSDGSSTRVLKRRKHLT